jgi:hypothetical protein
MRILENKICGDYSCKRPKELSGTSPEGDRAIVRKYWKELVLATIGQAPEIVVDLTEPTQRKIFIKKLRMIVHANHPACTPEECPKLDGRHVGHLTTTTALVWTLAQRMAEKDVPVDETLVAFVLTTLEYHESTLASSIRDLYTQYLQKQLTEE